MDLFESISQCSESIFAVVLALIVLFSIPHVRQPIVAQPGKGYQDLVDTSTDSSDEYVLTYSSKAVYQRIVLAVVAAIITLSVLTSTWLAMVEPVHHGRPKFYNWLLGSLFYFKNAFLSPAADVKTDTF